MKSHMHARARSFTKRAQAGFTATVLVATLATAVQAASWNIASQGDCYSGYPRGVSELFWEGYPSSSWGETNGILWYWNGSSWENRAEGYSSQSGSTNNAQVNNVASHASGTWAETGAHIASFFSGQKNSESGNFSC